MKSKQTLGKWGESTATSFLEAKGYQILEKNWRSVHGEIDIIAIKENEIVFVEVKTRTTDHYGFPEEAVQKKKRQHLINCAVQFIQERQLPNEWRIDIISIRKLFQKPVEIEWFQNAVREE